MGGVTVGGNAVQTPASNKWQAQLIGHPGVSGWRRRFGRLRSKSIRKLFNNDRGIVSAKAKTVAHGVIDFAFFRLIWRIVQIAIWVRSFQIDRGWHDRIVDRFDAKNKFNSTAGTE